MNTKITGLGIVLIWVGLFIAAEQAYGATINVPGDADTIQEAINDANDGDTVRVAEGTYYENLNFTDKKITLTSTDPNDADVVASTVIDGNDAGSVITFSSGDADSTVTGFTIKNGNAYTGGGIYCHSASPTITNCVIRDNDATWGGGICTNNGSDPTITNCVFINNDSTYDGGGMCNWDHSDPVVTNCLFYGNSARYGGAVFNEGYVTATLTNCTLAKNTATDTGGIYNGEYTNAQIRNCILWDDSNGEIDITSDWALATVSYSDIEGCGGSGGGWDPNYGTDGGGNIDNDPCFVDIDDADGSDNVFFTADDGLKLQYLDFNSPCIDAANGNVAASTDIMGCPRVDMFDVNNTGTGDPNYVDMGAYEAVMIWFVDVNATGGNDGSSWSNAFTDLQDALGKASNNQEIWVAEGTYKPHASDRNVSFELVAGVDVYGGFDGTETDRSGRDWTENTTTLSGDIAGDNSYHVVKGADDATLDGFTVTMGNADGSGNDQYGGGFLNIQASPNISNCIIKGNYADYGGGIYNYGIITDWSLTNITNCIFTENQAGYGAAVFNYNYSWDLIVNCTFSKNDASVYGGAIYDYYSYKTDIANSILWGDTDSTASDYEIISDGSWVVISYSNRGNMATTNGGTINQGSGNFSKDPLFADADNDDFHLKSAVGRWNGSSWVTDASTSLCINTGNPSSGYSNEPTPNGSRINMGFYGNTTEASKSDAKMVVYVDCDNTTSPFLGTPGDPYKTIEDGTDAVGSGGIVYVLDGTYTENLSFDSGDDFSLIAVGTTIIDGDSSDCVIFFNNADNVTVDGFYITDGNSIAGGGMFLNNSSATIKNCRFYENLALYNESGSGRGGGIFVLGDSPLIQNCDFANNYAFGSNPSAGYAYVGNGGAIFVSNSTATFENCNVGVDVAWYYNPDDNHAQEWDNYWDDPVTAYEIYILDCETPSKSPTFTNCTVRGNGSYTYTDGGAH